MTLQTNLKVIAGPTGQSSAEAKWTKPFNEDVVRKTFDAIDLMPTMQEIPEDFHQDCSASRKFRDWQAHWFYKGLKEYPKAKPGINLKVAVFHLSEIQASWASKHEHKQAAVAWLASLWFEESSLENTYKEKGLNNV